LGLREPWIKSDEGSIDTVLFCRRSTNCNEYIRGKLVRQGPLQPVIAGTQKSWIGEASATEVTELQSENTESANGAEKK